MSLLSRRKEDDELLSVFVSMMIATTSTSTTTLAGVGRSPNDGRGRSSLLSLRKCGVFSLVASKMVDKRCAFGNARDDVLVADRRTRRREDTKEPSRRKSCDGSRSSRARK